MSSSPALVVGTRRFLGAVIALTVLGTSAVLTTIPARADTAVSARSGTFTIRGAGWGHGWGMSQYGAYGQLGKGCPGKRSWRSTTGVPS